MTPDTPTAVTGRRIRDALAQDRRPKLVLWADAEPVIPTSVGETLAKLLRTDPPLPIGDASHFLQEDAGDEVGRRIADWLG